MTQESIAEKRLSKALATNVTKLSPAQVRLMKIKIEVLSKLVAREHDAKLAALEAQNQRLKAEIARLQPTTDQTLSANLTDKLKAVEQEFYGGQNDRTTDTRQENQL